MRLARSADDHDGSCVTTSVADGEIKFRVVRDDVGEWPRCRSRATIIWIGSITIVERI